MTDEQPEWVCSECGNKYGRGMPPGHLATYHLGDCGVCGRSMIAVTEPRDYGYLDMRKVEEDRKP